MNKVFKVIWNHATQTWTAVSELGHAKGKTKSKKIVKLTALAGAVIGSLAATQTVEAAESVMMNDNSRLAISPTAGESYKKAEAVSTFAIAIGVDSKSDSGIPDGTIDAATGKPKTSGTVAIGLHAQVKPDAGKTALAGIAIGDHATATQDSALAIGAYNSATGTSSTAIGKSSSATNNNAIAVGTQAKATADNAISAGAYNEASGERATSIGVLAQASGAGSFAGGASAQATGANSVAIGGAQDGTLANKAGTAAKATGAQAIALGTKSNASGENSIAEGNGANASAVNATAIGKDAKASDNNAVALGSGSVTKGAIAYQSDTFLGKKYIFAGGSPSSVVSIGSAGNERQLVNVAAGRINSQSTDAINGSQLYAVADAVSNHHWVVGGNTTAQNTGAPQVSDHSEVKNKDIVEFQNGNGTKATIEHTAADQSSGTPAKTVVKYHANIVNGDNTEVVYNADGSVKINAKVAGGTDTTAAVTTTTTDALTVTNTTTGNVTTYNVDAKTGAISTTTAGAATYDKDGDKATGGNYGARLTNVSTVTDIVNNVSWHLNSSPVSGTNGKITQGSDTQAADVKASNTVNINAGKNIEIKRNGTTIEISSTAGEKGEKGDTGATGAKGDTGAAGAKGDTGAKGADGKNAEASVVNNGNGTHTVTIVDGNGQTTSTVVKDGKNAEASVTNNGNGTHTVTVVDGNGKTTTTVVKDGAKGEKGDTGAKGADGKNAEASVVNNGNGTHTVTIVDGNGQTTSTVVKDGKNAEASVTNNGNGTHTVTIVDGNGQTTSTVVKDGKDGKDGVMTWNIKSTGEKPDGTKENTKQNIKDTHTVEMSAGKNLTIEQTNDPNGVAGAKVEFALNSNVTNLDKVVVNGKDGVDGKDGVTITAPGGKDGNDGLDGKVGISGKDGKDAVSISGKDGVGQIGLTGPKGKDGKDGASVTISTDKGTTTVAERDGGEKINRVIYTDKDKDGNDIKREIATLDDGLKFTGDDGQTVNRTLGSNLNIKGGATDSTTAKNIRVTKAADGEGLDVNLANNIKLDNNGSLNIGGTTVKNGSVTNLDHHIDNPTTVVDDSVLNITDEKKKEAATVGDVLNSGWNLQANGKPVDAVTHGNNVNFASDKGTVTVTANSDGKTSVVNLDVNVDNDTITVNNKGQLVASGATNFNVATKDGGNKVAKKGGSSTTKITSGKTITYTAGKNIAIEQNGGDILVSTTNDVDHNSVTTNDLTVNKGGNIDMGGNQIHNVKAGTKDTDAVNVSQLKQSIGDVHKRINKVGKEARGGIAGANAAAGLPQVYIPGKSMVAASAGTFKGESAVAVGYSRSSDNGKVIFKLQGNANTQGDVGGSVGVGYQW